MDRALVWPRRAKDYMKSPTNPPDAVGGSFIVNLHRHRRAISSAPLLRPRVARDATEEPLQRREALACRLGVNNPPTAFVDSPTVLRILSANGEAELSTVCCFDVVPFAIVFCNAVSDSKQQPQLNRDIR